MKAPQTHEDAPGSTIGPSGAREPREVRCASKAPDIRGMVFGRLTVVERAGSNKHRASLWECRCECGRMVVVVGNCLRKGSTTGCPDHPGAFKHGHAKAKSPTYQSWGAMWNRCTRSKHPHFARYGGRGITVCERWRSFENFLADMGERPAGKTLDRIDNDGNYEPGNCRWATLKEQRANTSTIRRITVRGETRTLQEWAKESGICANTIRMRLTKGWLPAVAVTLPTMSKGYRLGRGAFQSVGAAT